MATGIKIHNGSIDDSVKDQFVIRGTLDPESLKLLKTAPYQREIRPMAKLQDLIQAFRNGNSVSDIELGMRGSNFTPRGELIFLHDPTYTVDGSQRVAAAIKTMELYPEVMPKLGARINFGTTEEWERQRFHIVNTQAKKLSPNILIRNMQDDNKAISLFVALCADKSFVLCNRVTWTQNMRRDELVTALTLLKVTAVLHAHLNPGIRSSLDELAGASEKTMGIVGRNNYRENVKAFYDLIDQCWNIRLIAYKDQATHLKSGFLRVLARYLSRHEVFWRDNRLVIERDLAAKIKTFPIQDPAVVNLVGSAGKAMNVLYNLLKDHVNSGKRSRRLVERIVEGEDDDSEISENSGGEDTDSGIIEVAR